MGTNGQGEGCTLPRRPSTSSTVLSSPHPRGTGQPPQYPRRRNAAEDVPHWDPDLIPGLNSKLTCSHCPTPPHSLWFSLPFPSLSVKKSFFPQCSINSQEPSDCDKLFQLSSLNLREMETFFLPSPPSVYCPSSCR